MNQQPNNLISWRQAVLPGVCAVTVLAVLFLMSGQKTPVPVKPVLVSQPTPYDGVLLTARAAVVYDVKKNQVLFSKNGDAQLPLASLTKIMTAITALSLVPESTVVAVNPTFWKSEGSSGLAPNEKWRLADLLDLTLVKSSNEGANSIAAVAGAGGITVPYQIKPEEFVSAMNRKAKELGLSQSYFLNPSGLDESEYVSGGYGSARDVSVLLADGFAEYPEVFGQTRYTDRSFNSLDKIKHTVKNTNTFVNAIPALLASKTGYTDLAGGNLTILFDVGPGRPIAITVLGSTEQGRFEDTNRLVQATLVYLEHE